MSSLSCVAVAVSGSFANVNEPLIINHYICFSKSIFEIDNVNFCFNVCFNFFFFLSFFENKCTKLCKTLLNIKSTSLKFYEIGIFCWFVDVEYLEILI
jgi:hypothetical protein